MNVKLRRNQGFTLFETLVAAGLLSVLLVILVSLIISTMRAQEFERSVRTAAASTRDAMNRMADELRLASILPSAGSSLGFVGASNVPSGVVLPDSYDSSIVMDKNVKKTTGDKGECYLDNRLIFVRPKMGASMSGKDGASYAFDPSDVRDYVYVEWMVPDATPDRVWRRVYNINNGTKCGHKAVEKTLPIDSARSMTAVIWMFNSTYFSDASNRVKSQGASSGNDESDWLVMSLNPGNTSSDSFKDKKISDTSSGGAFTRNKATVTFRVSHPIYKNPSNNTNIEPLYYTTYNRNLFKIKFSTRVYKDAKGADEKTATKIDMETQVRLQAGA